MTKQEEIKLLRDLTSSDTYFRQYFANDIDKMVSNIDNDFPIELGCSFDASAAALEDKRKSLQAAARQKVLTIAERIMLVCRDEKVMDVLRDEIGLLQLATIKAKLNIQLTKDETLELIQIASNNQ